MKIGVLTFWHGTGNYGMMLQCWALQRVLKRLGHDPYLIRYVAKIKKGLPRKILESVGLYRLFLRFVDSNKYNTLKEKKKHDALREFIRFREENFKFSDRFYNSLEKLQKNPPTADCYITGSDQVWSISDLAYFLDFGNNETKRISYAPSFGFTGYPDRLMPMLKHGLSRLDAISCREQSGVETCQRAGYNATKVADPTMLLDKEEYLSLASQGKPLTDSPYVFIYSLNLEKSSDIRFNELKELCNKKCLNILCTPGDGFCHGKEIYGEDAIYSYATIEQWLYNIANSALVITPSFHGIVLSIILGKPFIYTPVKGARADSNDRINGLLHELKLENRILTDDNSYERIADHNIDWTAVNNAISNLRKGSLEFLNNALLS